MADETPADGLCPVAEGHPRTSSSDAQAGTAATVKKGSKGTKRKGMTPARKQLPKTCPTLPKLQTILSKQAEAVQALKDFNEEDIDEEEHDIRWDDALRIFREYLITAIQIQLLDGDRKKFWMFETLHLPYKLESAKKDNNNQQLFDLAVWAWLCMRRALLYNRLLTEKFKFGSVTISYEDGNIKCPARHIAFGELIAGLSWYINPIAGRLRTECSESTRMPAFIQAVITDDAVRDKARQLNFVQE